MPTYGLLYAGVPFLLDTARVVQMSQPTPEQEHAEQLPPKKHQSEIDLIDELNRILPFQYLQDFAQYQNPAGPDLDAIAIRQPSAAFPSPLIRVGEWYYPSGATRWSVFRGLATSTQVKAMLNVTKGNSYSSLVMTNVPTKPGTTVPAKYTLSSQMRMMPPRPLAEHGAGFDGLYLVTLVDDRYDWQYQPMSLRIGKDTTWALLISQIATVLGISVSYDIISPVYGQPESDSQLFSTAENTGVLFDAVAYNIGCVVVRNLDRTYKLMRPENSLTTVVLNRGNINNIVRTAGGDLFQPKTPRLLVGDLFNSRNATVPASVNISFPKYITEDQPVPHFINAKYANQRPSAWYEEGALDAYNINVPLTSANISTLAFSSGTIGPLSIFTSGLTGIIGKSHTIRTTAKAWMSGEEQGTAINHSGLTSMAMQLASDYYGSQVLTALDEVYPGIFAWTPEGIHDIIWTYSSRARLATTRVLRSPWNTVVRDMQHASVAISGFTNVPPGVGGRPVSQTIRDSYDLAITSGIANTLRTALNSGDYIAYFNDYSYFPTGNRWKGFVENEKVLFNGTSGGQLIAGAFRFAGMTKIQSGTLVIPGDTLVNCNLVTTVSDGVLIVGIQASGSQAIVPGAVYVNTLLTLGDTDCFYRTSFGEWNTTTNTVYINSGTLASGGVAAIQVVQRGIDNTIEVTHPALSPVSQAIPDTIYGVNLTNYEKGQFVYPAEWTSGGIQGVNVVPQTQSVKVLSSTAKSINSGNHYSGQVVSFDTTQPLSGRYLSQELVWVVERNEQIINSGQVYDGQFVGYSASGPISPIYAIDAAIGSVPDLFASGSTVNEFSTTNIYGPVTYLGSGIGPPYVSHRPNIYSSGGRITDFGPMRICGETFWCYYTIPTWSITPDIVDLPSFPKKTVYRASVLPGTTIDVNGIRPFVDIGRGDTPAGPILRTSGSPPDPETSNDSSLYGPQLIALLNVSQSQNSNIRLKHQAVGAFPHQFLLPNARDLSIQREGAVLLWYDTEDLNWRVIDQVNTDSSINAHLSDNSVFVSGVQTIKLNVNDFTLVNDNNEADMGTKGATTDVSFVTSATCNLSGQIVTTVVTLRFQDGLFVGVISP